MERLPERIAKLACGVLVFKFKGTAVLCDFAVLHRRAYAFSKKTHRNHYFSAVLVRHNASVVGNIRFFTVQKHVAFSEIHCNSVFHYLFYVHMYSSLDLLIGNNIIPFIHGNIVKQYLALLAARIPLMNPECGQRAVFKRIIVCLFIAVNINVHYFAA